MADGQSLDWLQLSRRCVLRARGQRPTQTGAKESKCLRAPGFDGDSDSFSVFVGKVLSWFVVEMTSGPQPLCLFSQSQRCCGHSVVSLAALYLTLRTFYLDDETMTPLAKRTAEVKEMTRDAQFQMHHEVVPPGLLPRRDDMDWTRKKTKKKTSTLVALGLSLGNVNVALMKSSICQPAA